MAICRDKFTRYMNKLGYNVVRHPREGIAPLDLIGMQRGSFHKLGTIDKLVVNPNGPPPRITRDLIAADINGTSTSSLRAAVGVRLLGTVVRAQGGDIGVTAQYRHVRRLRFTFTDVYNDSVDPTAVGNLLRNGDVDDDNPLIEQYVLGNGRLFVITRIAKSNKLTVATENAVGGEVGLDVPAIQGIVSAGVSVKGESSDGSTISYTGPRKLVFGFECFEVGVTDGDLTMVATRAGVAHLGDTAHVGEPGPGAPTEPTILDPDSLVDVDWT